MKWYSSLHGKRVSELQSVTCHMGSHSVVCYPTQVNAPCHNPDTQFTGVPKGMEVQVSWPWCWLYTAMVHMSADSHLSKYKPLDSATTGSRTDDDRRSNVLTVTRPSQTKANSILRGHRSLCGRPDKPHYRSCASVYQSVHPLGS